MSQDIPKTPTEYRQWWSENTDAPYGFCWCGCGEKTAIAPSSTAIYGWVRDEPRRFVIGHRARLPNAKAIEVLPNATKLCECGCERLAPVITRTNKSRNEKRGEVRRFLPYHESHYPLTQWQRDGLTHDLAYVLGFILADGNISGNVVTITQKDSIPLEKIKRALGSGHPLAVKRSGYSPRINHLHICNGEFSNWVKSYGITERKSLTATLPSIPDSFFFSFLRGYFDGDGSAYFTLRNGLTLSFVSGSPALLIGISNTIGRLLDQPPRKLYVDKGNPNAHRLRYFGSTALRLGDFMYENAGELYTERKREVFERYRAMCAR